MARDKKKLSPHHRGRSKTYFLVQTSTIWVQTSMTRRVLETFCPENVWVDFLVPSEGGVHDPPEPEGTATSKRTHDYLGVDAASPVPGRDQVLHGSEGLWLRVIPSR